MERTGIFGAFFLVLGAVSTPLAAGQWSVFSNCNLTPCNLGLAVPDWYQPGWSRIGTYPSEGLAWQRACWLHGNDRRYSARDIRASRINSDNYR